MTESPYGFPRYEPDPRPYIAADLQDLHDLTDRELYRMSFDIAEVLVARAKCRLGEEAGVPAPVAMVRRISEYGVGGISSPGHSVKV